MDFFVKPGLSGLPPKDDRPKVLLEGDALVAAMCSVWNNLAASSAHIEPKRDPKITTAHKTLCERHQKAAARLGFNALSQWEVYISENERRLDRVFDRELATERFAHWMAEKAINLNRSPAT